MKIFALSSFLTYSAIAGAAIIGNKQSTRLRRDVAELASGVSEYLPPTADYLPPAAQELAALEMSTELPEQEEPAKLGANGYEYRTVRRLKLRRHRRDVSHLDQHYLPPLPSKEYLPPAVVNDDDVVDDTEEIIAQPNNVYLPPVVEKQEAESPTTESPTTESPTTTTESGELLTVTTIKAEAEDMPAIDDVTSAYFLDVPQNSAVLLADGYHYKHPEMKEDELLPMTLEANTETEQYLPPLNNDEEKMVVVVEGPSNGDSATLASDGYHYRAVKRYRF